MSVAAAPYAALASGLLAAASLGAAVPAPGADVSISVTGLRSAKGQVLACLTARADAFPNCRKDPAARKLAVPATGAVTLDFGRVAPGNYAVALLHDENGNGKADMMLMMPREGFGFSRDAPVRMGPPRFAAAAFAVGDAAIHQSVKMRYMM